VTTEPAVVWAGRRLAELGRQVVDEPEVTKDRSWSLVVKLSTDAGPTWLKVNRGGTTYEPAVLELLAAVAPGAVLQPLGLDVDRGWSLTSDGGPTLRTVRGDLPPDPEVMSEVVQEYARLQRATADHVVELLAAGVPDLRPARLPAVLEDLLEDAEWARLADPGADEPDPTARERVMAHRPTLVAQATELAERAERHGVPMTLQHDDLHDNNVFVVDEGGDRRTYRVFDWGDSCIGHPFGTLLVTLRSFASMLGVEVDDPRVDAVRQAYLQAWADVAPMEELAAQAALAVALGPVTRAHSWRNALVDALPDELDDFADAVPGWLAELVPLRP
jgi:hypothetical protein